MNVNQKGVKGLIKVIDDLQEKGFYVFPAFDDHSPIDLIAVDECGQTYRLQVKYRERIKNRVSNRYELASKSVVNGKVVPVDRTLIDGWAFYLADDNKVVYINKNIVPRTVLIIDPETEYGELVEWFKTPSC